MDKIPLVKFFITGRPELRIHSGFCQKSLQPHTEVLRLHEVKPSLVDSDIKLFLKSQFLDIAENQSDCSLEEDWPGQHSIDILCKKAAGFFIYASTVIKFVSSNHHLPDERLALIVSLPQDTSHEGRSGIDLLYTQVLEQAFHGVDPNDPSPYSHFKSVVGAVVLAFNPFSIRTLSDLMGNHNTSLRNLHSVLLVPENEEHPVQTFHKSFTDFLTDHTRCTNYYFFIDPSIHHKEILLTCLSLIKGRLKRNIYGLNDWVDLRVIEDLHKLRAVHIGNALEYASRFWASHLAKVSTGSHIVEELDKAIDEFFKTSFLFWIEVLILTENLNVGVYALNSIEWYTLVSCGQSFQ